MKRRVLGILLVTVLLSGVGAIAAACGDGEDELSVEEYFQKLQTISDDLRGRGEAVESEFETAFDPETSPDAATDAFRRFLSEAASASREALNDVESLDPPSEAEDAHNEFLRELRVRVELMESLADRAAEVESLSGLEELFVELEGPDFDAAQQRFEEACRALGQVAADNGIEVDLDCG